MESNLMKILQILIQTKAEIRQNENINQAKVKMNLFLVTTKQIFLPGINPNLENHPLPKQTRIFPLSIILH
ncbi:hypothetical protein XENTR_v10005871 [Xenopus tropicalis]|nr:hypothetical protein XENTR_v10005871 [Xenopus tropicalis]